MHGATRMLLGSLADDTADAGTAEGQHPALLASPLHAPVVPPPAAPPQDLSPVEQFAQEVRISAKWGPAVDVNVRGLMASGVMAGQPVHIQLKHKDPVYLQGEQYAAVLLCPDAASKGYLCVHEAHTCSQRGGLFPMLEMLSTLLMLVAGSGSTNLAGYRGILGSMRLWLPCQYTAAGV